MLLAIPQITSSHHGSPGRQSLQSTTASAPGLLLELSPQLLWQRRIVIKSVAFVGPMPIKMC
jgi:hypothetical protein